MKLIKNFTLIDFEIKQADFEMCLSLFHIFGENII